MRWNSRIIISLSDEVIEKIERRGLVKCSTYYESLIRKVIELGPEAS